MSDDKVMVGCKMPSGIVLHLTDDVKGPNGKARKRVREGSSVTLNGFAVKFGQQARHPIRGGFGLTLVPADFWEEWLKQNKATFPPYVNGLVFAHKDEASAQLEAASRARDVRSGLEALPQKPGDDPRVPKALSPEDDQQERRASGS